MKKLSIILGVLLGMIIATQATAQERQTLRQHRNFLIDDKVDKNTVRKFREQHNEYAALDLTDSQKEKIKEIQLSAQKEILQVRNTIGEKRARLKTLETADKADLKGINKTIDEIHSLRATIAKIKAENKQKIRALLTDEQRIHFDSNPHMGKDTRPNHYGK